MAENIPDGTQSPAEGAPQGHRTIKLTPLNVKPAPEAGAAPDQPENTSTIKIKSKVTMKPKAVPPPVSSEPSTVPPPMGMDTKTQAVPLKGFKKAGAPISLNAEGRFGKPDSSAGKHDHGSFAETGRYGNQRHSAQRSGQRAAA